MKQSDEIRITRWIEGELRDSDVQDLLDSDPDLHELRQSAEELGNLLRSELPPQEIPYPDFFNHQVMRRIEREGDEPEKAQIVITLPRLFASLVNGQGLMSGLAVVAVIFLAMGTMLFGGKAGPGHSTVVHMFSPDPEHSVAASYNNRAGATVISIDGIEPLDSNASVFTYEYKANGQGMVTQTTTPRQSSTVQLASVPSSMVDLPFFHPVTLLR